MPKVEFSELKKEHEEMPEGIAVPDQYQRTIYLPVSKEIVDSLDVDEKVKVVLHGRIAGLEAREGAEYSNYEIQLELRSLATEEKNEFTELLDDDEDADDYR